MWLLKNILRFKIYWIENYYTPEQFRQKHLQYATTFDPSILKNISPTKLCHVYFDTLYSNIEEYNAKLKYINFCISNNEDIPLHWCNYSYKKITLERWLINRDKHYVNVGLELNTFREQHIQLCRYLLDIERNILNEDNKDYTLRILSAFAVHLNTLVLTLLKAHEELR